MIKPPTLFMALSAADLLWLDFLQHALPDMDPPDIAAKRKTELAEVLATRPDLSFERFQIPWAAFWVHFVWARVDSWVQSLTGFGELHTKRKDHRTFACLFG